MRRAGVRASALTYLASMDSRGLSALWAEGLGVAEVGVKRHGILGAGRWNCAPSASAAFKRLDIISNQSSLRRFSS